MPVQSHTYQTRNGRQVRGSYVYFIKAGNFVKVGLTSGSLRTRMFQIQSNNPNQVHLLCAIAGDRRTECEWHARLHPHWVRGEWFHLTTAVYGTIAKIARSDEALVVDQHKTSGTLTRQDPKWRNARMERILRLMGGPTGKSPLAEASQ